MTDRQMECPPESDEMTSMGHVSVGTMSVRLLFVADPALRYGFRALWIRVGGDPVTVRPRSTKPTRNRTIP